MSGATGRNLTAKAHSIYELSVILRCNIKATLSSSEVAPGAIQTLMSITQMKIFNCTANA